MNEERSLKNTISYGDIIAQFTLAQSDLEIEMAWTSCVKSLVKNYSGLCRDKWLYRKFPEQAYDKYLFQETIKSAFFESILFTITKLLNHPEKFDLKSDVGSYLRIVLRNMAANAIRKVFNVSSQYKQESITAGSSKDSAYGNAQNGDDNNYYFFFSAGEKVPIDFHMEADHQEFPPECFAHVQLETYREQVLQRLFPGNPPLCGETIRYRCLDGFSGQDLFILFEYAIDRHLSGLSPNFTVNWSLIDLNNEIQRRGGKPYSSIQGLSNAVHRVIERFVSLSTQARSTCKNNAGKPCECLLKSLGILD